MVARRSTIGLVIFGAILFGACDKGGVYPLGVPKDVTVQCDARATTWLRSIEGATEIFVIGTDDFATLDAQLAAGDDVCFSFGTVRYDTSTHLFSGLLRAGDGGYEVEVHAEYVYVHEPRKNLVLRSGASRIDFEPPEVVTELELTPDGESLLVRYGGVERRLTRIGDVVERLDADALDPDAPGGAKDAFRVYNLALYTSQSRITGFGATGMTNYTSPSTFNALIDGHFTASVASITTPHVLLDYVAFEELDGIFIEGSFLTKVTMGGNGPMEGALEIEMRADTTDEDAPRVRMTVSYDDMEIADGVAAAGHYTLTFENGNVHELEYTMSVDEDLRGILPIEEGVP